MNKKSDEKNKIVVTDWFGHLHVVPASNADYYADQNEKNKHSIYQYTIGEETMTEKEANDYVEKNDGNDPNWTKPGDVANLKTANAEQAAKIEELEKQLKKLQAKSKPAEDEKPPK
jgi:hypothetical protein